MKIVLVLTLSWISPAFGLSSIEEIERAVATREVTSIDQLWRHLPFEVHASPVISYRGFGPVPTTARRPRLINANHDGNLFAVAATDKRHWSFDRQDLAAADPVTGELSLYLVDFKTDPVITRNPRECMGCHMVNGTVRLRVEPYPHWPGWFGHQDRLEQEWALRFSTSETRAMKQFLKAQDHIPRLLVRFTDALDMIRPMHNNAIRVTTLAVRAEARAALHRLKNSAVYARVGLALAATDGANLGRFAALLDDDLRADFETSRPRLERELRHAVIRYAAITNFAFRRTNGGSWRTEPPALNYEHLIPFEWAFRKAGLTLAAYSTSVAPGPLNINTGIGGLADYLRQFIADDLAAAYDLDESYYRELSFDELPMLPGLRTYRDDFVSAVQAKMCQNRLNTTANPQSAPPAPSP